MKDKVLYGLIFSIFWLISCLPFFILHLLADCIAFILHRVVGYRRKVVRQNLSNSFPEMSLKEIKSIESKFYHYLADYFVEEIKMMTMSKKQMLKRMSYSGTEAVLDAMKNRGGGILLMPHYANFEWIAGFSLLLDVNDLAVQVYKPLKNKYFDKLFNYIRSRFGGINVKKHSTARELVRFKRAGQKYLVGLIADQNPSSNDARYWTTFLNQDTVFMDGGERIAKMMNLPVFYCDLFRVKRGFGKVNFEVISLDPKQTKEGEITQAFAEKIECTIRRNPPYWFWAHKRWKHKRENA